MTAIMEAGNKIVLDLCGGTGAWSKPYAEAGYDVRVITLPKYDVKKYELDCQPYGILAAPECAQFSNARLTPKKARNLQKGMELVIACLDIIWKAQYSLKAPNAKSTPLKFWALENSAGMLKYFLGIPTFEFHPYDFGHPYRKRTYIWGWFHLPQKKEPVEPGEFNHSKLGIRDLEKLHGTIPSSYVKPKGQRKDKTLRAITPSGFAQAFFEANP